MFKRGTQRPYMQVKGTLVGHTEVCGLCPRRVGRRSDGVSIWGHGSVAVGGDRFGGWRTRRWGWLDSSRRVIPERMWPVGRGRGSHARGCGCGRDKSRSQLRGRGMRKPESMCRRGRWCLKGGHARVGQLGPCCFSEVQETPEESSYPGTVTQ